MSKCTLFCVGDCENMDLCRCPSCNGYLPRDFPIGRQFQCKRCGAVLETLPDYDEDLDDDEQDHEMEFGGKICVVPDYAVKIETVDFKELRKSKPPKPVKTNKIAYSKRNSFQRVVWRDSQGREYIVANGIKILLEDMIVQALGLDVREIHPD